MGVSKFSAISPKFYLELRDVGDFTDHFGIHKWRFVADIPASPTEGWIKAFEAHLGELPPVEASAIRSQYLQKGWIGEALLIPPFKARQDGGSWAENVKVLPRGALEYIVGDAIDPGVFSDWRSTLSSLRETSRTDFTYVATAKGLTQLLVPMMKLAPTFYIVDPYALVVTESDFSFFSQLLPLMRGSKCYKLNVVTRDPFKASKLFREQAIKKLENINVSTFDQFSEVVRDRVLSVLPSDRRFSLQLVDDHVKGKGHLGLHARYVLNRSGALRLDKGITISGHGEEQEAICVDRNRAKELFLQFQDHVEHYSDNLPLKVSQQRPLSVRSINVDLTLSASRERQGDG